MLTIRELIKTLYNALIQRMKKYRGNWEQNDPTADDYIKNRPFYADDSEKVVIVPNQQITFSDYGAVLTLSEIIEFVVGQSYEVKWDDVNYTCIAWDSDGIGAIGNQSLMGRPIDTGEPFIIIISKVEGIGDIGGLTATGTHTVEVTSAKIVKIDKKYLPNFARVATSGSYDDLTDAPTLTTVATSGNYNDLTNKPTIYNDVVRYNVGQNLTTAQKIQARANIGAGTSSFSGSYNDLTDIIVGKTYTYQSITINNIKISTDTTIPDNVKFEQITYQTTWKVNWSSSTVTFSLKLDKISRQSNYYKYSSSSDSSYGLNVYDDGKIRCFAPTGVYYVNVTFDSIAVSTDIQLDEKYIPGTIQRVADMPEIPIDIVRYGSQTLSENQKLQARTNIGAADAKAIGDAINNLTNLISAPKESILFTDQINGYRYIACMRDGNFITYCAIKNIEVTSMPSKTEYFTGEYFDPTGMVVSAVAYDGTTKEIVDYTLPESYLTNGTTYVEISYIEAGLIYTANVPITVNEFDPAVVLVDFEYTTNDDGTYALTGWKGTYNGEASTEMIIPNNGLIIV